MNVEPVRVGGAGVNVRGIALLLTLFALGACTMIPLGRKNQAGPALERKVVAQKKPPNILLAANLMWCEVSAKKFESVKVGEAVWCVWRR
ncbi:MAG: hypothetical protein P8Z36_16180 [Gemmatimonadota bacterium]|jgi:hypothetical protein